MYDATWVPGVGGHNTRGRTNGRLFVHAVNTPVFTKNPYGPIVGVRIAPAGNSNDVIHFESVRDADENGGFIDVAIYRCLKGQAHTHCGYRWLRLADYEKETTK